MHDYGNPQQDTGGRGNCTQLVFEWGTVQIKSAPKTSVYTLVNYTDVKGKLRLGELVKVQIEGQLIHFEILSFCLNNKNQDQVWIELGLSSNTSAIAGGES